MEAKVALWREVLAGTRHTAKTAMERYPQLKKQSCDREGLPSKIAWRPKSGPGPGARACDVKTYAAADVDALVARLAAPEPEQVDPRWREFEAGTRYNSKTAMERYPQLRSEHFVDLPFEIARRPKPCKGPRDVKTYAAADVDALVARLAAPEVDPRWLEVKAGARYDRQTALKRYPQLRDELLADLHFEIARRPKPCKGPRDVKTYLASDVDALVARLAAPEPIDPRWREVEAGARYDARTAMKRYPQLYPVLFANLPFQIARRPKIGKAKCACDVFTYAAADVDELAANHAPQPVDPRWLEVESGARYDVRTAMKRYPQLTKDFCKGLPFEIARRPKIGKANACDIKTYAAADVEKLVASRAKKRARVQEPEPPQEAEPEQEEPEECPVCLDPMTGATAALVCGHLFCKDCIADWARSQTTCPTCRATLQIAP